MGVQEIVKEIDEKMTKKGGVKEVFFIACGGSLGAFYPAKYLLESESRKLRVGYYTSNEFVHATPKVLGENTLAVVCSHQGNTPETVEAAKVCKARGATTITFTYTKDSPLTRHGDYTIIYDWGEKKDVANEKSAYGLKIAFELLRQTEEYEHYGEAIDGFSRIARVVALAKDRVAKRAAKFAEEYKNEEIIYVLGSGASFGAAYMQAICIFMEMQWINSASIHSGEFFHGPLEITDAEIPFMLLMNEGRTRELDQRTHSFLKKYGKKVELLDSKELGIDTIDPSVVEYFNHILHSNVLGVYNSALAAARQHPLATRRYMWKVQY